MPAKLHVKDRLDGNIIDLSLAELQEVPVREIAAVKKGIILDLSSNRLITLGKNFSCLTHLIDLDLSNNLLKELPEDFGELTLLRRLDLYCNKLTHLPLSFSKLKSLKWLDLKANPLVPRLAEIAGPCEDTEGCEECAINIVRTLSKTVLEVEEERKRRLKEQLQEKEREEKDLLAKKKKLEKGVKKNAEKDEKKLQKVKGTSTEKVATSSSAPPSPAMRSDKESASKRNAKLHSSKERKKTEAKGSEKKSHQTDSKDPPKKKREQATPVLRLSYRKPKDEPGSSLCTRVALVFVWLFLFLMLAAVSIVTFALWDRSLFELSASKLGPQGGAVAQYVLQKITGLTSQ